MIFFFFLILISSGSIFAQQAFDIETLLNPDFSEGNDAYGHSVAINNDYAIVGAYRDSENGTYAGAAYIFKYTGNSWEQQVKLTASDGENWDWFGSSVAIDGNRVVIGARNANGSFGAVYIYHFDGINWIEEAGFSEYSAGEGGRLGKAIAIQGDMVLAGATQFLDSTDYDQSGAVYVYQYNGSSWERQQVFLAEDHEPNAYFGNSIDIDGDQVIIGAYEDGSGDFTDHGAAYIFKYNGTLWEQQAKLTAAYIASYTSFGTSVAIEGNIVVIGTEEGYGSGSAYIFEFNGSSWEQVVKFMPEVPGKRFGQSVAIHNNTIVIGARPLTYEASSPEYVYIYQFDNNQDQWFEKATIDGEHGDWWYSVDMSGNFVVAGCLLVDSYEGKAKVFELVAQPYPVSVSDGLHNNRINVSWDNRSNSVENFKIYRDGEELTTEPGSAGTYNDYNAVPGKIYTYGVSA
ncbi:MAG: hypothetical protein KAR38_01305, partial [Calditrichia bacterium]|nr:hypothetical protein [Calditrichia bacterium]